MCIVLRMHVVNVDFFEIFQSLSDPYRIRIVRLMISVGELCLCELSEALEEPEYKLSRHIKILKNSGIITSTREGKWIYHSLVMDQSFLRSLYKSIIDFPDSEKVASVDLQKFNNRLKHRDNGRCKQPTFQSLFVDENNSAIK